jgi:hypothetical protein
MAGRQAEMERQVRAVDLVPRQVTMPLAIRAVEEARRLAAEEARKRNELLPVLRAQMEVEMHRRLGLNPAVEALRREIEYLDRLKHGY